MKNVIFKISRIEICFAPTIVIGFAYADKEFYILIGCFAIMIKCK